MQTHSTTCLASLLDQLVYTMVLHRVSFESEIEFPEIPSEIIFSEKIEDGSILRIQKWTLLPVN